MTDKVMPDLNAWLDFFKDRKTSKHRLKILDAFQYDNVYITGMILTQLLGAMPLNMIEEVKLYLQGLNYIEFDRDDYEYAGVITARLLEKKITNIKSMITLHARYCELHGVEFLSDVYEKSRGIIDETVVEMAQGRGEFKNFVFTGDNDRVYIGGGYLDQERAELNDLPENTIFQNTVCGMDYIHARSRKYLPEVKNSKEYSLFGQEGNVAIVDEEYMKQYYSIKANAHKRSAKSSTVKKTKKKEAK